MAITESWFKQDLKEPVKRRYIIGNFFSLDNVGNLVGVKVYDNGAEATLSGSVTGYCALADGTTVPVPGTRSGNQIYILLTQSALSIPGYIGIVLKLTDGNTITTLLDIIATVYPSQTDEVITPSSQVITDWSQQIDAALQNVVDASAAQDQKIADLKSAFELSGVALFTGTCNYYNGSNTYTMVEIGQTNKISAIFDYVTATSGTRAVCQRRKSALPATTADTIDGAILIKLKNENTYTKFNLRLASDPTWNSSTNHYLYAMTIYHSGVYRFAYSKQNIAGATWRYWYNIVEAYTDNIEAIYFFDNPDEIGKIFPQNATDALQLMDENPLKPLVFGGEWDGIYNGSTSATWRANPPSYIKNTLPETITAQSGVKGIVSAILSPIPVSETDFNYAIYVKVKDESKRVQLKPVLSSNSRWGGTDNNRADGSSIYVTTSGFYPVRATAVYNASNPKTYKYFLIDFVDYTQLTQIQNIEYIMVFPDYAIPASLNPEIVGKKWVGYGDSITEQGRWEYIVYNAFKLRFTNLGLGGSCVADVPNASVAGFCDANRIASIPADTDFITIMGGTNDFGQTADIGSIEALRSSFDRSTFMGALAYLIKAVQTQAPNARIIIMSNPNSRGTTGQASDNPPVDQYGHSVYDFAKAARDVANYMSVDFIDVYACGINTLNRTRYVDDTVHPNVAGGKLIGRKVLEFFSIMRVVN